MLGMHPENLEKVHKSVLVLFSRKLKPVGIDDLEGLFCFAFSRIPRCHSCMSRRGYAVVPKAFHSFLLYTRPTIGLFSGTPCAKRHSPAIEQPWTSQPMLP